MDFDARQELFVEAVQRKVGADREWKLTQLFGVSNRAILIEGALQIGAGNLDSWSTVPRGAILASVIRFPPADEIYFAVVVERDCDKLLQRLLKMKQIGSLLKEQAEKYGREPRRRVSTRIDAKQGSFLEGAARQEELLRDSREEYEYNADADSKAESINIADVGDLKYRDRNNTVGIYLSEDGKIYMRNSGFWDSFPIDRSGLDPVVEVDRLLFAVYPPEPSAKRNLLVRDFVGYFVRLVGRDKVEEIQPWPDEISIPPTMRRTPSDISISEISEGVRRLGGYFTGGLLERYHVSLNHLDHKHFVILTGLSGTGKTSLAKFYASAVHGIPHTEASDPFFFMCPVRPDWTDPTGLIGYHDVLSGKYIVTPFLEAVLVATAHKDSPVFVCIDEMNIARAEFYFADVLSAMESKLPLHLHSNSVPLDGSRGEPVPDRIQLSANLFITGTINIDETTQPLSDKILDRANTIDMSIVDVQGFLDHLKFRYFGLAASIDLCSPLLIQLDEVLLPYNLGFGYRIIEEFVRYLSFVQKTGIMEITNALDSQVTQKILVRLRGGEGQRDLLEKLTWIAQPYPRSLKIIDNLKQQLEEYGSFQNLR
jgi:5-methylcytosine-specific restriction protein B